MTRFATLGLLSLACGCAAANRNNFNIGPEPTADVSGTWTLSGSGQRASCGELILDGDFALDGMLPLVVRQTPAALGATLTLAQPVTAGGGVSFSFQGSVRESTVEFTTVETGPDYTLTFRFSGEAGGELISGSFTGSGPSGCATSGTFEVVVSGQAIGDDGVRPGDPLPPTDPGHADPLPMGDSRLLIPGDGLSDRVGLSCRSTGESGASIAGLALLFWALSLSRSRR